ncbi:MAG: CHASE3 domain-containing protein, partial [Asticcacaulis sp.]
MNRSTAALKAGRLDRKDISVLLALIFVGIFFVISGFVSYLNIRTVYNNSLQVMRTHDVLVNLTDFLGTMKDAETGQRGYLLTGDAKYLSPYNEARTRAENQLRELEELTADNPAHRVRFGPLKLRVSQKLQEIDQTIALRRSNGLTAALELVATDRGQADMDSIRAQIAAMQSTEQQKRSQLTAEMEQALSVAIISVLVAALLGMVLTLIIATIIRTSTVRRQADDWVRTGLVGLNAAMQDEQRLEQIGHSILSYLSAYTGAQAGAIFVRDGGGYKQIAHMGLPVENTLPERFLPGQTLLGQAALEGKVRLIEKAPEEYLAEDYLTVATALGQWRPSHLIIAAAKAENKVEAVFELGYLSRTHPVVPRLIEQAAEGIAMAIRAANYRAALQELLEETQRQSEELQSQSEELRVNNEELEEQSRALKEAFQRLEQQQAELEQTNNQLSDQTRLLELQRDDLARSQAETSLKAQELEQASRYKSDFLANMSHELRTPLNSSLILAKLLADNAEGNLTAEQIKFAQTIQSSGNDLLLLINDILDLSKIEAGQMEIEVESISIKRLIDDLTRLFSPVANEKGLGFSVEREEGVPDYITSDRLRLEQVLKNL